MSEHVEVNTMNASSDRAEPTPRAARASGWLRGDTSTSLGRPRRLRGQGGYALAMTALLLVPLCIFTATAVDLGAWYAQAARMQRAADAASLAGVVWLPNSVQASTASNESLSRNWTGPGAAPTCGAGATCQIVNGVQWQVEVGQTSQSYFAKVAGVNPFPITRSATAAVNPPVPLGSPLNTYGNQLPGYTAPTAACTDPGHNVQSAAVCAPYVAGGANAVSNVWATINGPYEIHANGDPFSTRCWGDTKTSDTTGGSCTDPPTGSVTNPAPPAGGSAYNPYYKPDGYLYAVDVKVAGTVNIEIYDAAFDARRNCTVGQNGGSKTGPYNVGTWDPTCNMANNNNKAYPFSNRYETGDNAPTNSGTMLPGPTTEFQLYNYSGNNYQINATPANAMPACRLVAAPGAPGTTSSNSTPTIYKNKWVSLCSFTAATAGIYPLRVRVDNIPGLCTYTAVNVADGCKGAGQNSFAIRATGASSQVYAMDNMDLYSNWNGLTSTFYLADVRTIHKGKKVVLDMYDPGDGGCLSGNNCQFALTVKGPDPTVANALKDFACSWVRSDYQGGPSNGLSANPSPCTIVTRSGGNSSFNGQWLRVTIQLPTNYTCPVSSCWWKVVYNFNYSGLPANQAGDPSDHTTWAFNVIGDPVHLVQ